MCIGMIYNLHIHRNYFILLRSWESESENLKNQELVCQFSSRLHSPAKDLTKVLSSFLVLCPN